MCLVKDEQTPRKELVSAARSPWAKLLNRQILKPSLPKKVASSARVNLNKCWLKLGELISNASPRTDLPSCKTAYIEDIKSLPFAALFPPLDAEKPRADIEGDDNAMNQNLSNGRFELIFEEEINDNLANEVREICYTADQRDCLVCKLH